MSHPSSAAAFAPMRLLRHVPEDGRPSTIAGAVLFADLADFTGLTEALAAKAGTDGAALVGRDLNAALGPVIDAVVHNGGEVVKFSGDGLLCVFLGADSPIDAAQRAAQDIAAATVHGPTGELHRFRIAIVSGLLTVAQIGGHRGRFEVVAGGEAVEHAQDLVGKVAPGTIGPAITLSHLAAAPLPLDREDFEAYSYVPDYVRSRLGGDLTDWMQELRSLTILFASVEIGEAPNAMQSVAHALQVIVDRQGGQLLRFSLESRRLIAEVAFGLPIGAGSTGPAEALQCARALIARTGGARVGISTGRVLLGPIGSAARRQLTTLGATVNLAARLMQQAAEDEAAADEPTWNAAGGAHHGIRSNAVLKGLGSRGFWRIPVATPPEAKGDEAFFGRDAEIEAARADLASKAVPARPVVIQGEAGIGKSRFCRWLAGELRAQGDVVWLTAATPVGRDTPYSGLASTVAELCGLQPGMNEAHRLRKVAANVLGDADRAPLLGDVLGLSLGDTEKTAALNGNVRAENIREALVTLICGRSERGAAALIVEDAHWLDSASWALLQRLAHETESPRIVLVTRPMRTLEPPELDSIRSRDALVLDLAPLATGDITAVVAARMEARDVPVVVTGWIIERAQGNPFFAQELAAMLMGVGLVRIRDGEFLRIPLSSELDALPLARTIESTLEQRIDRLDVENAVALKVASVIGPSFSLELLAELAPLSGSRGVEATAERLLEETMIVREGPGQFAFRHRYTQEAAYRMLPVDQRRGLHRRVADWLETRLGERSEDRAGEIAHHWFEAQETDKAIRWLDFAGVQALRTGADREAATHFRRVLSIGDDQPIGRRAAWRRQLARALFGLGEVEGVAIQARIAVELVGQRLPHGAPGWVWFSLRTALRRLLGIAGSTGGRAADVDDLLEGARAAGLLAESAYFVNAPEMMVGSALLAVGFADRTVKVAPVSVAYGMLGMVAGMARLHGVALRYLERGRALAEAGGDTFQLGVAWFYTAMYCGCIGDWRGSLEASQRALSITEALGADMQSGFQLTLIATNALYTSEYSKTRAWMLTVRQRAERSANVQQLGWASNVVSVIHLHQEDYDKAIELSERAKQIFLVERDLISLIISEGVQSAALARSGAIEEALVAADRASVLIGKARPTTWGQLEGFAGPCEAYALALDRGLIDGRRARTALAGLLLFAIVFPFGRPRYRWIRGLFAIASGSPRSAQRHLRRAIVLARDWNMPFEEWRATDLLTGLVGRAESELLRARAGALRAAIHEAG
ncbi:MAG TPA: AAA family ATPase [Caldimonas sp.]|nr:AAA family ATPase [Caldimonas sp.]